MSLCLIGQTSRCQSSGCEFLKVLGYPKCYMNINGVKKTKEVFPEAKIPVKKNPISRRSVTIKKQREQQELKALRGTGLRIPKQIDLPHEGTKTYKVWMRCEQFCYLCLHPIELKDASIDHVVPLSRGGRRTQDNEKATHRECNGWKADKLLEELDLITYRKSKSYYRGD